MIRCYSQAVRKASVIHMTAAIVQARDWIALRCLTPFPHQVQRTPTGNRPGYLSISYRNSCNKLRPERCTFAYLVQRTQYVLENSRITNQQKCECSNSVYYLRKQSKESATQYTSTREDKSTKENITPKWTAENILKIVIDRSGFEL